MSVNQNYNRKEYLLALDADRACMNNSQFWTEPTSIWTSGSYHSIFTANLITIEPVSIV